MNWIINPLQLGLAIHTLTSLIILQILKRKWIVWLNVFAKSSALILVIVYWKHLENWNIWVNHSNSRVCDTNNLIKYFMLQLRNSQTIQSFQIFKISKLRIIIYNQLDPRYKQDCASVAKRGIGLIFTQFVDHMPTVNRSKCEHNWHIGITRICWLKKMMPILQFTKNGDVS